MNKSKNYSDKNTNSIPDQELKFLLHFILALSKKQRRKLFIELSKYDIY
ncbi:hypothetical protein HYU95_00285 [Candidatus Daviesbacteria bacterium]|nr:hypothetical protein [Candidatus Daviesbacteria bacterium]